MLAGNFSSPSMCHYPPLAIIQIEGNRIHRPSITEDGIISDPNWSTMNLGVLAQFTLIVSFGAMWRPKITNGMPWFLGKRIRLMCVSWMVIYHVSDVIVGSLISFLESPFSASSLRLVFAMPATGPRHTEEEKRFLHGNATTNSEGRSESPHISPLPHPSIRPHLRPE